MGRARAVRPRARSGNQQECRDTSRRACMPEAKMIINYVPGEECRVAIVEDGKLEEYYVERFATASRVGNIYLGRVANVEPAIQAAFVDFGVEDNGFLHISDLHPRYFPGEEDDATERVGFKTPRRERPAMQQCLRRGDEVIVQVLKEGVGTKGPSLTSYLSIPGRFLVMMPYMDKTGVSRKVEDEEQRRAMREILDQLDLPEGFGFIVRTAGMERTKVELKRDLAYLQRLWKDMERRLKAGGKARLLYSESDLLVRSLRDLLTADVKEVVIDHDVAVKRASSFMKIVAPRGQARLMQYTGHTPIFHAFGIEEQIALIHAREVPLPSGGRLVIDQTEALVAIDVNSGKSRESRDSETNAYQTNIEAVDEICRQLRLRDLGGIVINDLIDMRSASHRKDIETRMRERLKRDRARTTTLAISEFGILEMTRQRMRASHESVHFADCPICRGRGMVQRPDSIAADALRELAAVVDAERVAKVEMVVAPRVAGELLSTKRQLLSRIERGAGKHVDVRVSETVQVDRVSIYPYDAQGEPIEAAGLPKPRKPKDLVEIALADAGESGWAHDEDEEKAVAQAAEPAEVVEPELHPIEIDQPLEAGETLGAFTPSQLSTETDERRGRRRRRGGRGRGGRGGERGPGDRGADRGAERGVPRDAPQRGAHADRSGEPRAQPVRPPMPLAGTPGPAATRWLNAGDHGDADDAALAPAPSGSAPVDDQNAGEPGESMPIGGDQQGQGDEVGPDGQRRRRRRRRRGRGRGRGGQGGPMDQRGPIDQGGAPAMPGDGTPAHDEAPGEPRDQREPLDQGEPMEPRVDGDGAPPPAEQGEGGDRRRRRRRRGRGGRGRGGGQDQAGAPAKEVAGDGGGPRPAQDRPPQNRGPRDGQRQGGRQPAPRSDVPQIESKPSGAEPTGARPPRTLYSNVRRRLGPGELNKRPKPE